MSKHFRVLGKRGRINLPIEIREKLCWSGNDILSFEVQDNGTLLVRKEQINAEKKDCENILAMFNSLPESQQREILIKLSVKWAEKERGGLND